jgi:hypothetical protein
LTDEERQLMKAIIGGKSGLREIGLKSMRVLKRILIIQSNVSTMSGESFHPLMAFNVMNSLVFFFI